MEGDLAASMILLLMSPYCVRAGSICLSKPFVHNAV